MKLWKFIKDRMMQNPNQMIGEKDIHVTFKEVVGLAEGFVQKLKGIRCCAICCDYELAASVAILGCFAAEVTALPLSKRYGEVHCKHIFDAISPDAYITDEGGRFCVYKNSNSTYKEPEQHPAVIMCTSGTTGKSKGAMLSEENILTNVRDIVDYFEIGLKDSILIARPLYHCAVLTGEFLAALVKGTRIYFYSGEFNPYILLERIKDYRISTFCGTPTLLGMMARLRHKETYSMLKNICISGECLDREQGRQIADAFPASRIYHVYGLTEASPRVSYLPPELFRENTDCVGIPLKSVSVKIIKENGMQAVAGEEGILWVKGNNVMLGYYHNPEKTTEILQEGWLCTGDVAVMNHAGFLKIKGRKDDLIIKAGMNIYPAEIESVIKRDSRVKEVMVYGIKNVYGTQIGMKISGDFASIMEIKQLCAECLPAFQIPIKIELVNELPKNGSGKIVR